MLYEEWSLTVGEIVAPFGLAGEVKVRLETDFPERFARLHQICLRRPDGSARLADVESARLHKGQILLKLRDISCVEAAETLRNTWVQVRGTDAVRLPANEFYIHDLVGCDVWTAEGRALGTLTTVLRGGANDVYVVHNDNGREILLPAVQAVVRAVDLPNRRIVVTPTPGLLPEELDG